jgi:DNA (cytosine-5)-methyltransferase 1
MTDYSQPLRHLDIFSGIGGFALGFQMAGGFETVAFCEIDKFCQQVLRKHWPDTPIYDDVRTIDYAGTIDVITGGYPCQPFSNSGKRQGKEDDRHLWPAMFSLIQRYRPTWVLCENVDGHVSMGLDDVLADLESALYTTRALVIPACAKGAPHRRDRVWIVGHANSERCQESHDASISGETEFNSWPNPAHVANTDNERKPESEYRKSASKWSSDTLIRIGKNVANTKSTGRTCNRGLDREEQEQLRGSSSGYGRHRETQSGVGRGAHGLSERLDGLRQPWHRDWERDLPRVVDTATNGAKRLRALGNAVVPQVVAEIGKSIMEAHRGYAECQTTAQYQDS